MDWKDVQQLIRFQFLDSTGAIRAVSGIANAAAASTYGAELSADAAITERFKLSTQVGYLRAKYDDYPAALIDGLVLDLSGKTLVDAPRWTLGAQGALPDAADFDARRVRARRVELPGRGAWATRMSIATISILSLRRAIR